MASKLLRRSGVAVGLVCDVLEWRADTIIQAGVGFYHHEVEVLRSEWPGVRWYGVEPHPGIFESVRAAGDYDLLVQVAASDRRGEAVLHMQRHHADGSSLFPVGEECIDIEVSTDTLDAIFLEASGQIDFGRLLLWLDCEGNELAALRGATGLLRAADVVNVEITGDPRSDGWCLPWNVHDLLIAAGFIRQWVHTGRITLGQYDAIYVRSALFRPGLCCDPWSGL